MLRVLPADQARRHLKSAFAKLPNSRQPATTYYGKREGVIHSGEYVVDLKENAALLRTIIYSGRLDGISVEISIGRGREQGAIVSVGTVLYLARRPGLGGNKERISADEFKSEVRGFEIIDFERRSFVLVSRLDDPRLATNVSRFASECDRLRFLSKAHDAYSKSREGKDEGGPTRGGKRSAATWEARHSPLATRIGSVLDGLGCQQRAEKSDWRPDLIRNTPLGSNLIVEIKPNSGLHNIMTAIGQVICYRWNTPRSLAVIAAPGISKSNNRIKGILRAYSIYAVDLNDDEAVQFEKVVRSENNQ